MKKQVTFIYVIFILPLVFILIAMSNGSPGGRTGSPGDNTNNCSSCHSGSATQDVSGWINSDIPPDGYMPGDSYTITLEATDPDALRFGFELTAEDINGNKIGEFVITNSTETKLVNSNNAVTHTNQGFTPVENSKSWSFDWTAPEEASGSVFFYAAVNAADGDGSNSGDQIYLTNEEFALNTTNVSLNSKNDFYVYPNPSQNNINISVPEINSNTEIKIYNLSGQTVFVTKPESVLTNIDVSEFPKGVYFVKTNNYPPQKILVY